MAELTRRVVPGPAPSPAPAGEDPQLPQNWQEHCLHPTVKLSHDFRQPETWATCLGPFLTVPTETILRRRGLANQHTYVVDAGLYISVCLRNLSDDTLLPIVKFCHHGEVQQETETRTMYANTTWNLIPLILTPGEPDNELHIYDSSQRELLTLIFKVSPPTSADGPGPTTMTLPDGEVRVLVRSENLKDDTLERLAYSGIYTREQLQNMTEAHCRKYGLDPLLLGIGARAAARAATPPQDGPVLSHAARRKKRKSDEALASSTALASMSSLLDLLEQ